MEKSRGIKDIYDLVQRKNLPHAMIFEAQDIEKGLSECMELFKITICCAMIFLLNASQFEKV